MYKKFKLICICGEDYEALMDMSLFNPDDEITCCYCGLVWTITVKKREE